MTLALDWDESSVSHSGRTLPSGKDPLVPIGQEAGWASDLLWTQRLEEKSFATAGDRVIFRSGNNQLCQYPLVITQYFVVRVTDGGILCRVVHP
jgi:hypothetical protein